MCGGRDRDGEYFDTCERYSFAYNIWEPSSIRLPGGRMGPASAVIGQHLYIIGGYNGSVNSNSVSRCDTVAGGMCQPVSPMRLQRVASSAVTWRRKGKEDTIVVCGGNAFNHYLSSCEMYHPKADRWSPIALMTYERGYFALVQWRDRLLAFGGENSRFGDMGTIEEFKEWRWKVLETRLQQARDGLAAIVY